MPSVAVVIPTFNAKGILAQALASLRDQQPAPRVIVVDNASHDGTSEMVAREFPAVELVSNPENLGFGRAINRGAELVDEDILILINNDCICEPDFVARMVSPFSDASMGMVAGVLTQQRAPGRIDSAGIVIDSTLGSSDYLGDQPVAVLSGATPPPLGPCGGAAAYRTSAFREAGGFDETFFAYWEDVDLAIRLRCAGWRTALAWDARAEHRHGATLGGGSPRQRQLDAFGRGYILARYRVGRRGRFMRLGIAIRDWPTLASHAIARREIGPIVERRRGLVAGRNRYAIECNTRALASVPLRTSLAAQWSFLARRLRGRAPAHYGDASGVDAGPADPTASR